MIQGVYVAITAVVLGYVFNALDLREFGFTFLNDPAGFKVGNQWLTDVDGVTNSRITMYLVGVWSTLRAVIVGIALATVLGVLVGVSRLSSNWLVAQLAMLFVETFRNTPLLVQVVLVYTILLVGAPLIENAANLGDFLFLSNRGIAFPWPVPDSGFWGTPDWFVGVWVAALLVLGFAAMRLRANRQALERDTGQPHYANRWALGMFARGRAGLLLCTGRAGEHGPPDHRGHALRGGDVHGAGVHRSGGRTHALHKRFHRGDRAGRHPGPSQGAV